MKKSITSRPYRYLSDFPMIRQFMIEIYERDWRNGVPAPFFEYAMSSTWADKTYIHRNCIWFDKDKVVAFTFIEARPSVIFFSIRPGYEFLAEEMVNYAQEHMMCDKDGKQQYRIFASQKELIEVVQRKDYVKKYEYSDLGYDFENDPPLEYSLPDGFKFADNSQIDRMKSLICYWKGFDHEPDEGPWTPDHIDDAFLLESAPNFTPEYPVYIENRKGEYVCAAGMWWTPENHLAYMEPLATVPEYRGKGLAAAALSELYRRMKPLGATFMTGGAGEFYKKIGFKPYVTWTAWEKCQKDRG